MEFHSYKRRKLHSTYKERFTKINSRYNAYHDTTNCKLNGRGTAKENGFLRLCALGHMSKIKFFGLVHYWHLYKIVSAISWPGTLILPIPLLCS